MDTHDYYGDPFTGARATPSLVGRDDELAQIQQWVREATTSTLIHVVGEGGIGKTRILAHLLKMLAEEGGDRLVARGLVDLYHAEVSTIEGLVAELVKALDADGVNFPAYAEVQAKLQEARTFRPHAVGEIAALQEQAIVAFREDLAALSQERPVIIGLDTAEKLDLQHDPIADMIGVREVQVGTIGWLAELLQATPNLIVVLAGRQGRGDLAKELQKRVPLYHNLDLKGLTEAEALAYFDAVVARLESTDNEEDRRAARRVKALPPEIRRTIFYALRDGAKNPTVRPILLALAIDFMVVAESDQMQEFLDLEVAMAMTPEQCADVRNRLGAAFINLLSHRLAPADRLVRILGWLRKGATKELLREFSGLSLADFNDAWERIQGLSFVKIRPRDSRIFLHDEMYQILQKHALDKGTGTEMERVYSRLRDYYEATIKHLETKIDVLFRPLAPDSTEIVGDASEINRLRAEVRSAIIEDIFYRLRWNALRGFQAYFRAAEEAISVRDVALAALLRAEMRAFVEDSGLSQKTDGVDGLRYANVVADEAVRWIELLTITGHNEEALDLAQKLSNELFESVIRPGGIVAEAELSSWRGLMEGETGNYAEGERLIGRSIELLTPMKREPRWVGILARAYNNLGYVYRLQGRNHRAIAAYREALPLWSALKMDGDWANTSNNLGFALAEIGDYDSAQPAVRDAIRIRERYGPQRPIALSLNTLAEIEIRQFLSEVAIDNATRACDIFRRALDKRGLGLSLRALAEALRRSSSSPANLKIPGRSFELLVHAEKAALEGISIFDEESGVIDEPVRLAALLIELGCIYRTWLRFHPIVRLGWSDQTDTGVARSIDDLFRLSVVAFQRAVAVAENHRIESHRLDAMIGCIRAYHFRHEDRIDSRALTEMFPEVAGLAQEIQDTFVARFGPLDTGFMGQLQRAVRDEILLRRGDWETLQAELALHRFGVSEYEENLREAAIHFVLAFACNAAYSPFIFAKYRASRARVHEALVKLNNRQRTVFYGFVIDAEQFYDIGESDFRKFYEAQFGPPGKYIDLEF